MFAGRYVSDISKTQTMANPSSLFDNFEPPLEVGLQHEWNPVLLLRNIEPLKLNVSKKRWVDSLFLFKPWRCGVRSWAYHGILLGKSYPKVLTRPAMGSNEGIDQSLGCVKKAQLETRHLELYQESFSCNVQSTGLCVSTARNGWFPEVSEVSKLATAFKKYWLWSHIYIYYIFKDTYHIYKSDMSLCSIHTICCNIPQGSWPLKNCYFCLMPRTLLYRFKPFHWRVQVAPHHLQDFSRDRPHDNRPEEMSASHFQPMSLHWWVQTYESRNLFCFFFSSPHYVIVMCLSLKYAVIFHMIHIYIYIIDIYIYISWYFNCGFWWDVVWLND